MQLRSYAVSIPLTLPSPARGEGAPQNAAALLVITRSLARQLRIRDLGRLGTVGEMDVDFVRSRLLPQLIVDLGEFDRV